MDTSEDDISLIDRFMIQYERLGGFDAYSYCAQKAKEVCESRLKESSIFASVTCRAKEPDRLRKKLESFDAQKEYRDVNEIKRDLVDLAGVRIAVYYPDEKADVKTILSNAFIVNEIIEGSKRPPKKPLQHGSGASTYQKRFFDYRGDHYHVYLKPSDLTSDHKPSDLIVEIQIVTVISNAWSELEHDILYKQFTGTPSVDEYQILDSINGLVNVGELLLDQLYQVHRARVESENRKFRDQCEVRSFLRDWISTNQDFSSPPIEVGQVQALFVLTQKPIFGIQTPRELGMACNALKRDNVPLERNNDIERSQRDGLPCNLALLIMKALLHRMQDSATEIRQQTQIYVDESNTRQTVLIITNTLLWIDEIFPSFNWGKASMSSKITNDLRWLLRVDLGVLETESALRPQASSNTETLLGLQSLWYWLAQSNCWEIRLIFNLTCLGMLKDSQEVRPQLLRLYAYFEFLSSQGQA